jgi:hypothetical protein
MVDLKGVSCLDSRNLKLSADSHLRIRYQILIYYILESITEDIWLSSSRN